jgi:hypothetical protein
MAAQSYQHLDSKFTSADEYPTSKRQFNSLKKAATIQIYTLKQVSQFTQMWFFMLEF